VAEARGELGPQGVQRLLNGAVWDIEGVRDDLRQAVIDPLGQTSSGLLMVDETGFLTQGKHSCGVAPHYTGIAGCTANAQVGVYRASPSAKGAAFMDRTHSRPRAACHALPATRCLPCASTRDATRLDASRPVPS
jgi:SRSO17 transposase